MVLANYPVITYGSTLVRHNYIVLLDWTHQGFHSLFTRLTCVTNSVNKFRTHRIFHHLSLFTLYHVNLFNNVHKTSNETDFMFHSSVSRSNIWLNGVGINASLNQIAPQLSNFWRKIVGWDLIHDSLWKKRWKQVALCRNGQLPYEENRIARPMNSRNWRIEHDILQSAVLCVELIVARECNTSSESKQIYDLTTVFLSK
jgi:hypothetical protein